MTFIKINDIQMDRRTFVNVAVRQHRNGITKTIKQNTKRSQKNADKKNRLSTSASLRISKKDMVVNYATNKIFVV